MINLIPLGLRLLKALLADGLINLRVINISDWLSFLYLDQDYYVALIEMRPDKGFIYGGQCRSW